MLGISGVNESHTRPMTAQFEQERGPIWFFASTENAIVQALGVKRRVRSRLSQQKGTICSLPSTGGSRSIRIALSWIHSGTATLPHGSMAAKATPELRCCGWMLSTLRSGLMHPALWRG